MTTPTFHSHLFQAKPLPSLSPSPHSYPYPFIPEIAKENKQNQNRLSQPETPSTSAQDVFPLGRQGRLDRTISPIRPQ